MAGIRLGSYDWANFIKKMNDNDVYFEILPISCAKQTCLKFVHHTLNRTYSINNDDLKECSDGIFITVLHHKLDDFLKEVGNV